MQEMLVKPTREEAEEAVRILLRWAGENPLREGLLETPARVVSSYDEYYAGYAQDPKAYLEKTFEEVGGYDEIVMLRDIPFESHCEHHMQPIIGKAHVAYLPDKRVVGISKLARVVDLFAKRLQVQERMTAEIAETIDKVLKPFGVAVIIEATHQCMTTRGVHKPDVLMVTTKVTGRFKADQSLYRDVVGVIGMSSGRVVRS